MNPEHPQHSKPPAPFWRSRTGLALLGFLAIAGFFLFTEHRAHVLGVLPLVLVALGCPLAAFYAWWLTRRPLRPLDAVPGGQAGARRRP